VTADPTTRPAARLVGIDLGTTNSSVAWVDASAEDRRRRPQVFEVRQLVSPGEVRPLRTLPSFLYLPTEEERDAGALALPWDARPEAVAGLFAREQGTFVPARQAASAKSWLSHPAIDRRAPILPYAAGPDATLSPVDVSTRLLAHLRDAWNHELAARGLALQDQEVVLTVPASFDEEARELTVEAARQAGFAKLTLLEEPLAAVYSWIAGHSDRLADHLSAGQLLLVCDVGGGTTDFSLIRASTKDGAIEFERIAIGEHLLLGGDNVDAALAAMLERKLAEAAPGRPRLTLTQRLALQRQASAAKERLLADDGPDHVSVTILGAGRSVVGSAMTAQVTRDEVVAILADFLPITAVDERPQRYARQGLRELGLPYVSDPAVTRHLAAFLVRAAAAQGTADAPEGVPGARGAAVRHVMVQPDLVLFNGGFFTPAIARDRVLDAFAAWFGTRPGVLTNRTPDAAVAIGAAFYAAVRRAQTRRQPLIRAGSARCYYIALHGSERGETRNVVCVTPRGTQEGTRLALDREFSVITNQPAAFTLLSSTQRDDALGTIVAVAAGELHEHAPLVTALRYGQRSRKVPLGVRLVVVFTEVGTLEIWCESRVSDHRWRLQFNLRDRAQRHASADEHGHDEAATADLPDPDGVEESAAQAPTTIVVAADAIATAAALIRDVFGIPAGRPGPDALIGEMERALAHGKHGWPLPTIRQLADVLLEVADGRRTSARHEARWLNLAGFCLRPGFGTTLDPFRITEMRKVYVAGLTYPKEIECQVQWLVLWQRVSAGFTTSQQQELAGALVGMLGLGSRKASRLNEQVYREAWRLLASLERLDRSRRVKLGEELVGKVRRDPQNAGLAWAIGRLGARTPLYGGLNAVVPADVAERWIEILLTSRVLRGDLVTAIADIAARTGDPVRDVGDDIRSAALTALTAADASPENVRRVRESVPVDDLTRTRVFGETLPQGLRLE
jgi:molecular chaperone DnaK (HSP70)